MVKLKAPLMSLNAAGTLAGTLDFANVRGRHVVAKHRKPKQPRTAGQRAARHVLTWLGSQWRELSAARKATWESIDLDQTISPYHRYMRYNVKRLYNLPGVTPQPQVNEWYPSQIYPAGLLTNNSGFANEVITPHSLAFTRGRDVTGPNQNWGMAYYHITPAKPRPVYDNIIAFETVDTAHYQEIRIGPLPAGPQVIWHMPFTYSCNTNTGYWVINVTILP